MGKSFYKQLGSTLAHIQDLFDTVVHGLIKSSKRGSENRVVENLRDAGDSYYNTYANIKEEKRRS